MLRHPETKYRAFHPITLTDRTWPDKRITRAPIWMATDLRDGNQSLIEPMNTERKLRFFKQLVKLGFKEIEVGFPSASQTDFDFVRMLIEDSHIPDDVTIEVLTQSREELIRRTIESLRGVKKAIIHLYNPTAPAFRDIVYNMSQEEIMELAISGTRQVKTLTDAIPETQWTYQYSPEVFNMTELDFAKRISDAVSAEWGATPERKMILNLPATVEYTTPNVYADQIEWMCRNLERRDSIIISVHTHNDRGTAVAAAELAIMAGAERVEGCLFGSGERTGNVDLITLALNLYSHGIDPGLDISDIDEVRQCVEYCNQISVHPRHPYVGDLVYTAFSGSHQDAIKKGFARQAPDGIWQVPYLPIDPADVGRSYDAVIRVNSQSGKGGMAYLLEHDHGLNLPRRLQIAFSREVQMVADETGQEIKSDEVYTLFKKAYLEQTQPYTYVAHSMTQNSHGNGAVNIEISLQHNGETITVQGQGNGPIDACISALDMDVRVVDYHEHALSTGSGAQAVCYIEMRIGKASPSFGVGIDANIVIASLKAILSGINRQIATNRE